jgi:hypothetical protein
MYWAILLNCNLTEYDGNTMADGGSVKLVIFLPPMVFIHAFPLLQGNNPIYL